MTLHRKRILPTLAVLVVACVQVFGIQKGYVCDHGDSSIETKAEHCHRVQEDGHEHEIPCKDSPGNECDGKGEKEHHQPLAVDLQSSPASQILVFAPVFVAVLIADVSVHHWELVQALAENERLKTPLDTGGKSPPSAAVQVARCMVILV